MIRHDRGGWIKLGKAWDGMGWEGRFRQWCTAAGSRNGVSKCTDEGKRRNEEKKRYDNKMPLLTRKMKIKNKIKIKRLPTVARSRDLAKKRVKLSSKRNTNRMMFVTGGGLS